MITTALQVKSLKEKTEKPTMHKLTKQEATQA